MSDKYEDAIAYLTEHPNEIEDAWGNPSWHVAGCLFVQCGSFSAGGTRCGCLTQVRRGMYPAANTKLTNEIRADERIPLDGHEITVEHLPVFAEWQRRLDREFNRK